MPHGRWAQVHGLIVKKEGFLCFSHVHGWKPKRSPRTPSGLMMVKEKTLLKDRLCTYPAGPVHVTSTYISPSWDLTSFSGFQMSDWANAFEESTIKNDCATSWMSTPDIHRLVWASGPSGKGPPCSCWQDQKSSLGIICKFPPCRMKLSNDICCL